MDDRENVPPGPGVARRKADLDNGPDRAVSAAASGREGDDFCDFVSDDGVRLIVFAGPLRDDPDDLDLMLPVSDFVPFAASLLTVCKEEGEAAGEDEGFFVEVDNMVSSDLSPASCDRHSSAFSTDDLEIECNDCVLFVDVEVSCVWDVGPFPNAGLTLPTLLLLCMLLVLVLGGVVPACCFCVCSTAEQTAAAEWLTEVRGCRTAVDLASTLEVLFGIGGRAEALAADEAALLG